MMAQINQFQDAEYHKNVKLQIEREKQLKMKLEEEARQLEKQVLNVIELWLFYCYHTHFMNRLINSERNAWLFCGFAWLR